MGGTSKIEWTDSTFNPWIGCTKVGPGCDHCYAEALMDARHHRAQWGAGNPRYRTAPANWKKPLHWNRKDFAECRACGYRGEYDEWTMVYSARGVEARCPTCRENSRYGARRRVFCASLADWLDNEVHDGWFLDLLDLIGRTPNLDWLLLTKRIGNWRARIEGAACRAREHGQHELATWLHGWWHGEVPENVCIGATVVNQVEADRDVLKLLAVPARVRFLSIEPMLGPVDLTALKDRGWTVDALRGDWSRFHDGGLDEPSGEEVVPSGPKIDWVIAGGESGTYARPMHPAWVRSLRDQCGAAGVSFLFKQWGEFAPYDRGRSDGSSLASPLDPLSRFGKKLAGRQLDGRTHDGFPQL